MRIDTPVGQTLPVMLVSIALCVLVPEDWCISEKG